MKLASSMSWLVHSSMTSRKPQKMMRKRQEGGKFFVLIDLNLWKLGGFLFHNVLLVALVQDMSPISISLRGLLIILPAMACTECNRWCCMVVVEQSRHTIALSSLSLTIDDIQGPGSPTWGKDYNYMQRTFFSHWVLALLVFAFGSW